MSSGKWRFTRLAPLPFDCPEKTWPAGMEIVASSDKNYLLLSPWQAMSITTVLARMSTSSSPCEICTP